MAKHKRLGELLVGAGMITEAQLRGALGRQKKWGGRLGGNLVKLGNLSESQLLRFLAAQTGVSELDISNINILPHIVKMVPEKVADKYTVMPIAMKGPNTLIVAFADPTDLSAVDHLSFVTGNKIEPVISPHSQIVDAINKYYRNGRPRMVQTMESSDSDLTVELSGAFSDADPDLIIFNKSREKEPPPRDQGYTSLDNSDRSFAHGPPPNMPDPFHSSSRLSNPALLAPADSFTLDFTPDWGAPAPRQATQPVQRAVPPLPNPSPQAARPQQQPSPQAHMQQQRSVPNTQNPQRPRSFTIEQKMRALYNVLIRKGLVKEAEIHQELMRLWKAGKL